MIAINEAASTFLGHRRIAVTGVSRDPASSAANIVYRRLRDRGYEVFAVNPHADEVEGDRCYHDLEAVPGPVEAVVIATPADAADATMTQCVALGITYVWMHRSFGAGSVSETATEAGRAHGITVIDGGCPLMFEPTSDGGHKFLRLACTLTGKLPRTV